MKESYIGDLVLHHDHAAKAKTKCKPLHILRDISYGLEDLWVHHASTPNLKPSTLLADRTPRAVTQDTGYKDLKTRFGKGKVARS